MLLKVAVFVHNSVLVYLMCLSHTVPCPAYASRPDNLSPCECDEEYISTNTGLRFDYETKQYLDTCTRVACPVNAVLPGGGQPCECAAGYSGEEALAQGVGHAGVMLVIVLCIVRACLSDAMSLTVSRTSVLPSCVP